MTIRTLLRIAIAASPLLASTAHAQLFRAYLAADGNDGNPCTLQAPCRLLPAALNAVASGGEIWMLDSANYNTATVTINKSVSILAVPGVVGSVVALSGGPAISIVGSGLTVSLRNVVIGPVAGATPGTFGVTMPFESSSLTMEDSLIAGIPGYGVYAAGTLNVINSTMRNNLHGIRVAEGGRATISRSRVLNNASSGIVASSPSSGSGTTTVSVTDSVVFGGNVGIQAAWGGSGGARVSITRTTVQKTSSALLSTASAGTIELNVGGSLIVENDYAWNQQGVGSILSLGSNQMSGNGGSVGVLTPLAPQ